MSKKVKILLTAFTLVLSLFIFCSSNVYASEYDEIQTEVVDLVNQGKLQTFHRNLARSTGYQTLYTKMYRQGSQGTKDYFANMSQSELVNIIDMYENKWNDVWFDILTNIDI